MARGLRRGAPVAHVLGAHVEMSTTPKTVHPYGTTYQPNEHAPQLSAAHDDFVIDPP